MQKQKALRPKQNLMVFCKLIVFLLNFQGKKIPCCLDLKGMHTMTSGAVPVDSRKTVCQRSKTRSGGDLPLFHFLVMVSWAPCLTALARPTAK